MSARFGPLRAAAIDLDGTLLSSDKSVSEPNRAALRSLREHGVTVILASGRHLSSMAPIARSLPEVEWIVSSQGAAVCDVQGGQMLREQTMPADRVAAAVAIGARYGLTTIAYGPDGIFTVSDSEWLDAYAKLSGVRPTRLSVEAMQAAPTFKVIFYDDPSKLNEAERYPEIEAWDAYRVRSLEYVLELSALENTKARGLEVLLSHLDLGADALAAFGDAPNDLPMLEMASASVAMSTGWDEVKAAARWVTPEGPQETAFARGVDLIARELGTLG